SLLIFNLALLFLYRGVRIMKQVMLAGVAARVSAAMETYRKDEQAQLTVFAKGQCYSYGQCGLPYVVSGGVDSVDDSIARRLQAFREKYKIESRIDTIVESVNLNEQTVSVKSKETNNEFEVEYDKLLIASGASSIYPEWAGSQLSGIHRLGTIPDANELLKDLDEDINNVTIIGGGYIGLEAA